LFSVPVCEAFDLKDSPFFLRFRIIPFVRAFFLSLLWVRNPFITLTRADVGMPDSAHSPFETSVLTPLDSWTGPSFPPPFHLLWWLQFFFRPLSSNPPSMHCHSRWQYIYGTLFFRPTFPCIPPGLFPPEPRFLSGSRPVCRNPGQPKRRFRSPSRFLFEAPLTFFPLLRCEPLLFFHLFPLIVNRF